MAKATWMWTRDALVGQGSMGHSRRRQGFNGEAGQGRAHARRPRDNC